jgi:hypothetical protein
MREPPYLPFLSGPASLAPGLKPIPAGKPDRAGYGGRSLAAGKAADHAKSGARDVFLSRAGKNSLAEAARTT